MKRIEIADTAASAANYELDDGRIFRIHLKLITPQEQLGSADFVEVETRGFEVTKNGSFVVDDDGMPVLLAPQRARIPLANIRSGLDSAKPGWIKQTLPDDKDARAQVLDPHKSIKTLPKSGEPGDVKRVGDELYTYTDGLYEQVRRGRIGEVLNTKQSAPKLDADAVASLVP